MGAAAAGAAAAAVLAFLPVFPAALFFAFFAFFPFLAAAVLAFATAAAGVGIGTNPELNLPFGAHPWDMSPEVAVWFYGEISSYAGKHLKCSRTYLRDKVELNFVTRLGIYYGRNES
jgi:hypothetical protein